MQHSHKPVCLVPTNTISSVYAQLIMNFIKAPGHMLICAFVDTFLLLLIQVHLLRRLRVSCIGQSNFVLDPLASSNLG